MVRRCLEVEKKKISKETKPLKLYVMGNPQNAKLKEVIKRKVKKMYLKKKNTVLIYNSHSIQFTHLKVYNSVLFSIFTDVCRHHHSPL